MVRVSKQHVTVPWRYRAGMMCLSSRDASETHLKQTTCSASRPFLALVMLISIPKHVLGLYALFRKTQSTQNQIGQLLVFGKNVHSLDSSTDDICRKIKVFNRFMQDIFCAQYILKNI